MQRQPQHHDDSWENDPVWKLLDESPRVTASPHFADDVVRAARLGGQTSPWWSRLFSPIPLAGMATAATACVIAFVSLRGEMPAGNSAGGPAEANAFAEIQEIAETEALLSAVDDLDKFSDLELVSLIGL